MDFHFRTYCRLPCPSCIVINDVRVCCCFWGFSFKYDVLFSVSITNVLIAYDYYFLLILFDAKAE